MDVDFTDILEKSRALRSQQEAGISAFAETIPRLERALPQIDVESRRLVSHLQHHHTRPAEDPRALRLLSEYGYETDKIERSLQSVALLDVFEPSPSVPDTDLDAFLASGRQLAVAAAVDTAARSARVRSLAALSAALDAEWDAAKRELVTLAPLSLPSTTARRLSAHATANALASPFRNPRAARLSFAPTADHTPSHAQPHVSLYHPVVRRLLHASAPGLPNVALATEMDEALLTKLAPRADATAASRGVQHLHAIFTALRYVVGEQRTSSVPMGVFEKTSPPHIAAKVCSGAREYLCLQFREDKMKREIELRPVEARRGGVPGVRADVRAYLNLIFNRGVPDMLRQGPVLDDMPFWPQVFYCLRAGYTEEALEIVDAVVTTGSSDASVMLFRKCLAAYVESGDARCIPENLLGELVQHYGVSVRRGNDPYQRVCFVVIARVDPAAGDMVSLVDSDYSLLFYSIEDYLWLLMSVVRMEGQEKLRGSLASYSLSLNKIGEEMRSFGPAHFDPQGETPTFYALVLILTGQFAEAIQYLNSGARAVEEALHITLILYHYGMLRNDSAERVAPDNEDALYHSQLNVDYAELLWRYVSRFLKQDAATAAVYVFTVRERAVRNELLKKVILESKAFDLLVGRPTTDSTGLHAERSGGVIAELWEYGDNDDGLGRDGWVSVVVGAAELAENRGDRESAMTLYDVGGVAGKVVSMLIERLSAELTSKGSPSRAKVFDAARRYHTRLAAGTTGLLGGRRGVGAVGERALRSLRAMLALGEFFDLRWAQRYDEAQQLLEQLNLLPRDDGEVVNKLNELHAGSRVWDEAVCDRIADVLLAAMEVLAEIYVASRTGNSRFGTRIERSGLRAWAKTLVNFSGMMPNLSPDISARLVRFEVMMS